MLAVALDTYLIYGYCSVKVILIINHSLINENID